MGVPFEQLGPGQVGRWVYQVIGKNGPIFNPQNIRYMAPEAPIQLAEAPMSDLALGMSGLTLIASVVNLAVSAKILSEVKSIARKLDQVISTLDELKDKANQIQRGVERIELHVVENHLRHALDYQLSRAISENAIDLQCISELASDVNRYIDAIPDPLLFNFKVRLSSDVRDRLLNLVSTLRAVRLLVAARFNEQTTPYNCLSLDLLDNYIGLGNSKVLVDAVVVQNEVFAQLSKGQSQVIRAVKNRFTFSDTSDTKHFNSLLQRKIEAIQDVFVGHFPEAVCLSLNLPDNFFDCADPYRAVEDVVLAWFTTDGGLIWQLAKELDGLVYGYEEVFWPKLKGKSSVLPAELEGRVAFKLEGSG
ncbi:hypothetical protein [Geothermobacter hydrogeniphilus]|uniref:Uncharacterized protein n=1 Tax=Geothermobacter hydrogeniphilus TaxID=1969733 RepID=A0A1X0XXH8_9BACT|nr:hypothetical protein [Geothermobacter hydrogeniphilus]ORJ57488.1 hypothetical protein B5V00_13645 [Geothermobacter hydrogeniphilus]